MAKKQGQLNHKGESCPPLVSAAPADLSKLALSPTKEVSEDEEAESKDMAEVEQELDSSPLEVLTEASVGSLAVLSSAATFCCGSQEVASKVNMDQLQSEEMEKTSVKNQTAGLNVTYVCQADVLDVLFLWREAIFALCFLHST